VRAPRANAICERFGGSLRRECLDLLIRFNERHLQLILRVWDQHFNHGRPHRRLIRSRAILGSLAQSAMV
jgi:transposase InsO family protein